MKAIRILSLVVLVVVVGLGLGTACTGEQGLKGDPGAEGVGIEDIVNNGDGTITVNLSNGESYTTDNLTGPQGIQGSPGPNMIVAMGTISSGGDIRRGYNIDSCTYNVSAQRYEITLTGITYLAGQFVTVVTPENSWACFAGWGSGSGMLHVTIRGIDGNPGAGMFSFVVLQCPQIP